MSAQVWITLGIVVLAAFVMVWKLKRTVSYKGGCGCDKGDECHSRRRLP